MTIFLKDRKTGEQTVIFTGCGVAIRVGDAAPVVGEVFEAGETIPISADDEGDLATMVLSPILQQSGADYLVVGATSGSAEPPPLPASVRVEITMDEAEYLDKLKGMLPNPESFTGRSASMILGAVLRRIGAEGEETLLFLYAVASD